MAAGVPPAATKYRVVVDSRFGLTMAVYQIKFAAIATMTAVMLLAGIPFVRAQTAAETGGGVRVRQRAIADMKQIAYAGNVDAQLHLGVIYLTGDGVPKDDVEAVKWLRKAADQDNPLAERYLAEMYFKGRGVPADNTEAAKWLRMAAEQGDAESEHNLAVLYTEGERRAAKFEGSGQLDAQSRRSQSLAAGQQGLGVLYENGDGVPSRSRRGRQVVPKSN